MTNERRCENCGCDPVVHARLVRNWRQSDNLYKKEAAAHAITRAEFTLFKLDKEGEESWAQSKLRRQAQQIKEMNERMRGMRTRSKGEEEV